MPLVNTMNQFVYVIWLKITEKFAKFANNDPSLIMN